MCDNYDWERDGALGEGKVQDKRQNQAKEHAIYYATELALLPQALGKQKEVLLNSNECENPWMENKLVICSFCFCYSLSKGN